MTLRPNVLPLVLALLSSLAVAQTPDAGVTAPPAPSTPASPAPGAGATPPGARPTPATPAAATATAEAPVAAPDPDDEPLSDRRVTFGAAVAPAALPAGSMAAYAFLGVPELGAGVRQGFGPFELEGRLKLDYLELSATFDLMARIRAYRAEKLLVAPYFGLGTVYNTGVTYADAANFNYFALRLLGGAVASYGLSETVRAIASAEVPVDLGVAPAWAFRIQPLVGAGAEFYVGEDFTLAVLGMIGVDVRKDPVALARLDLGYHLRIALGYRLF